METLQRLSTTGSDLGVVLCCRSGKSTFLAGLRSHAPLTADVDGALDGPRRRLLVRCRRRLHFQQASSEKPLPFVICLFRVILLTLSALGRSCGFFSDIALSRLSDEQALTPCAMKKDFTVAQADLS